MSIKRVVGGLLAGGIAVFAGTTAMEDKTTRDDAGAIVEAGGLGAFAVRVGDCVQMPKGEISMVQSVEGVPCEGPHDAQVYAEFDSPASNWPGRALMEEEAVEGCGSRFETALGAYDPAKNLDMTFFTPTEESWQGDDRKISCFVISADGTPLTGSKLTG